MLEQAVIYTFVALVLIGGFIAAFSRPILYAIIGLGISLLGLAGLFLNLGSAFVAAMQVLIYIGGITVAIVFAMMLSIAMSIRPPNPDTRKLGFAIACAVIFFGAVAHLIRGAQFQQIASPASEKAWSVGALGHALLTHYNLVFETLSLVLLLAIIGAILIARKASTEA